MIFYRNFFIAPKRDLPQDSKETGFLVLDHSGANVMPAATWFQSVPQAKHGIDVWVFCEFNAEHFWEIMQPVGWFPGDDADSLGCDGSCSRGRFHSVFKNGIITKVWLDSIRPWDGKPKFQPINHHT